MKRYRSLFENKVYKYKGVLIVTKFKSINNGKKYNRSKFNRMDYPEQEIYTLQVNEKVIKYNLTREDGSFYTVSKKEYDKANVLETEQTNFYSEI